jgi:hypothetical protein
MLYSTKMKKLFDNVECIYLYTVLMYGVLFQVMNAGFENEFFLLKSITRYGIQYYIYLVI